MVFDSIYLGRYHLNSERAKCAYLSLRHIFHWWYRWEASENRIQCHQPQQCARHCCRPTEEKEKHAKMLIMLYFLVMDHHWVAQCCFWIHFYVYIYLSFSSSCRRIEKCSVSIRLIFHCCLSEQTNTLQFVFIRRRSLRKRTREPRLAVIQFFVRFISSRCHIDFAL